MSLVERGAVSARTSGPYGDPAVLQVFHPLPDFDGLRSVVGSRVVGDRPCGMGIREDATTITGNRPRFVPHAVT